MVRDILELGGSLGFLDEIYDQYQQQPDAVDASWHDVLNGQAAPAEQAVETNGRGNGKGNGHAQVEARNKTGTTRAMPMFERPGAVTLAPITAKAGQPSIWPLVNAYRSRGHFAANLDPLGLLETARIVELDPATWGFSEQDMDRVIEPTGVHGMPKATLRDVLVHLKKIYAGSAGLEFMHISSPAKRSWLAERSETCLAKKLPTEVRTRMLALLINAEQFERFCHTKYPGTKRFSLEGSESLIPALDLVLTHAARLGAIEAVLGMAHRGRLTTIEQILKRPARDLFGHFEDVEPEKALGGGDVKYHLGFSTDRTDPNGYAMHVSLAFNPSHLEAVDPVVVGRVRAKQTRHGDLEHRRVVGVLVHGDAAFAGQGLVPET
ncbi:MAG TPA: 2-oxoglutarate dehydrogenase E1 component, partial [Kofleriaceae bacterium]|nr:2-oxoglutarate dehydrogenase E1 component [Kofleriaceae bacterium]